MYIKKLHIVWMQIHFFYMEKSSWVKILGSCFCDWILCQSYSPSMRCRQIAWMVAVSLALLLYFSVLYTFVSSLDFLKRQLPYSYALSTAQANLGGRGNVGRVISTANCLQSCCIGLYDKKHNKLIPALLAAVSLWLWLQDRWCNEKIIIELILKFIETLSCIGIFQEGLEEKTSFELSPAYTDGR